MGNSDVLRFLSELGHNPALLAEYATAQKETVLALAARQGYGFDEAEFNATIWEAEAALAALIGEPFDFSCSLWEIMWGKSYLEFLALTVAPLALGAKLSEKA
ncbi:Nif11-like leader peptide family natural product precursor [Roseicyclus mahoneyensis]|uniref:Nitrogen fixation uncharacterized protein n=1 Tax=Roseicyclus mahoneyensis TaxID=164332 RepID=A0A316GDY2_9RHOB|nr:Nif11-like leader peptide family natural product precursor [Roseicyclus mahoneyensis]PWK59219.1 nitrogen fixation uncharacterized protein [Roseicyclus mahoneyensis]